MSLPQEEWRCGSVQLQMYSDETATKRHGYPLAVFRTQRRYRDQKGDWHSSPRLFKRDLLDLAELCHAVYQQLSLKERSPAENKSEKEE